MRILTGWSKISQKPVFACVHIRYVHTLFSYGCILLLSQQTKLDFVSSWQICTNVSYPIALFRLVAPAGVRCNGLWAVHSWPPAWINENKTFGNGLTCMIMLLWGLLVTFSVQDLGNDCCRSAYKSLHHLYDRKVDTNRSEFLVSSNAVTFLLPGSSPTFSHLQALHFLFSFELLETLEIAEAF